MTRSATRTEPEAGNPLYRIAVLTVTALVIGVAAAVAAIVFVDSVIWLNNVLLISPRSRVQYEHMPWLVSLATVAMPALGGLIVGVALTRFCAEKRPLSPADVIEAVQTRRSMPDWWSSLLSSAGAAVSLGFGASVGQYGPMVYLGAAIGDLIAKLRLNVPNLPAIAMACGVAAAIATAFNAPIAGLVFAHEVVLRHNSMQSFAPTTVSAATGYFVANVVLHRPALFLVEFGGVEHGYEFLLFGSLGVAAAAMAIIYMTLILRFTEISERTPLPRALRPAAAGLALGVTALWLPEILAIGEETLRFATIEGAFGTGELFLLIAAKTVMTALCLGFGFPGGVFSPSLLIGALFGALVWTLTTMTGEIETSGVAVYAICGMMAVTSSVVGAPLSTILIVFELTRNYDITIAAMVAVVFSNLIANRLFGRSLFDVQLAERGVDLSAGRDRAHLSALPVSRLCSDDFRPLRADTSVPEAVARLSQSPWREDYVTDAEGVLTGMLRRSDAASGDKNLVAEIMRPPPLIFDETTTIWEAMRALEGFVGDAVPVVDSQTGRLSGVVTQNAIIAAYVRVIQDLRREENAAC